MFRTQLRSFIQDKVVPRLARHAVGWRFVDAYVRARHADQIEQELRQELSELRCAARQSELTLYQSRLAFESLIGLAHGGVIILAEDQTVARINSAGAALFGLEVSEIQGQRFVSLFMPRDLPRIEGLIDGVSLGEDLSLVTAVGLAAVHGRHANGKAVPIEVTITRTGNFTTLLLKDLSARKKAEHETALLAALVQSSPDAIISFTAERRIATWNEGAQALFGYTAGEAIGAPADLLVPPGQSDGPDWYFKRILEGGTFSHETRRRHKDGHLIDVRLAIAPIHDNFGSVIGISAMMHDVSERKRVEARIRKWETVFASSRDGLVIANAEGKIVTVNPAFETITGYSEADAVGRPLRLADTGRHGQIYAQQIWEAARRDGSWRGEVFNRRKCGSIYPQLLTLTVVRDGSGDIQNYVGSISDLSGIKESEHRLQHLANHDALTNLPNRAQLLPALAKAIERAERSGRTGAVLFVDLDRFKVVNESLGHSAGDELLLAVVARLKSYLRPNDMLARFGGDEFIVILEDLADSAEAGLMARALIDNLERGALGVGGITVSASIGISLFSGEGEDASGLIQKAATALDGAKAAGRGSVRFYDVAQTEAASLKLHMETRMRRALERGDFYLHYQPLVSLETGLIKGVEALLRWDDPVSGPVSPATFIPVAEDTGLIIPLGDFVLRTACLQMRAWRAAGRPISLMAINLSPRQFHLPNIDERLKAILEETGVEPGCIELEITEGALMQASDRPIEAKLAAIRKLGLRLAVDDFGTGYSSLAYLRSFPIDKLKVDRSFVRDIEASKAAGEIASAIIGLGKSLDLEVLAEGVETEAQRSFLASLGCDTAQGYLFSRPVSAEEIERCYFGSVAAVA